MPFLVTFLISMALVFLELSFMPYFVIFEVTPFLFLPFLIDLSLKSRNNFIPIIATLAGMLFDFASNNSYPFYTILFIAITLVDRFFFYRKSNYSNKFTFLGLVTISITIVYLFKTRILINNWDSWQTYLFSYLICILLSLTFAVIIDRVLEKYFLWLEEKMDK